MAFGKTNKAIKDIRKQKELTLDQLAEMCGMSKSYISRIERSENPPPISTLHKLANALGVSLDDFLLPGETDSFPSSDLDIMHEEERELYTSSRPSLSYRYLPLLKSYKNKFMTPFYVRITDCKSKTFQVDSEMFGYITKGEIDLYYDGQVYRLKKGDSFYFDSRKKHWYRCENAQAELITVAFRYRRF